MLDRYAVVGNPVAHSKSPRIHTQFAAATGQQMEYEKLTAPLDGFAAMLQPFFANGGKGLNVTVPFKEQAWELSRWRSPLAEKAGAVNTLLLGDDGLLHGYNTDGIGLVRDLTHNHGVTLAGKRVLVMGAGGAVRGVLGPLLAEKPAALVVANRTIYKAEELAELFASEGAISAADFTALAGSHFDLIINGTSASLNGDMPALPDGIVTAGATAYDMMYGTDTPFMQWARAQGATLVCDGLGMLVEQAAEAFFIWRGVRPETAPVLALMRAA
jgi:shikimate dehydrogenase